jgi:hypothetical protein
LTIDPSGMISQISGTKESVKRVGNPSSRTKEGRIIWQSKLNTKRLHGKIAVITGGNSGIGP